MRLFKKFISNCRRPENNFWGKMMLAGMNYGHNKMALWCIDECIRPSGEEDILDIGCGGGQNIANFLTRTKGKVCGADYSAQSVAKSVARNRKAVRDGRAEIMKALVSSLPYESATFDLATAFETIYFWPDIVEDFKEVRRVLKPGSRFAVCNEMASEAGNERWISLLDMKIYTPDEIVENMTKAGFTQTSVFTQGNHICVIGHK
ncbi:class I SAM-dependent methyltransferase [Porphyromonas gingivalis]|uniref:class I SAM-dependent methyltransferase n=1 Tax=Porphyromonas gingivalis TaxID=837 RepID=UPI00097D510A|nr:class I SAM-dependent methyltransferase [Porphyromonas gingivalis]